MVKIYFYWNICGYCHKYISVLSFAVKYPWRIAFSCPLLTNAFKQEEIYKLFALKKLWHFEVFHEYVSHIDMEMQIIS